MRDKKDWLAARDSKKPDDFRAVLVSEYVPENLNENIIIVYLDKEETIPIIEVLLINNSLAQDFANFKLADTLISLGAPIPKQRKGEESFSTVSGI